MKEENTGRKETAPEVGLSSEASLSNLLGSVTKQYWADGSVKCQWCIDNNSMYCRQICDEHYKEYAVCS